MTRQKLIEDAAVLCSAYATCCVAMMYPDGDVDTQQCIESFGSWDADRLAMRALREATNVMQSGMSCAEHWALACSMLRNGEVLP